MPSLLGAAGDEAAHDAFPQFSLDNLKASPYRSSLSVAVICRPQFELDSGFVTNHLRTRQTTACAQALIIGNRNFFHDDRTAVPVFSARLSSAAARPICGHIRASRCHLLFLAPVRVLRRQSRSRVHWRARIAIRSLLNLHKAGEVPMQYAKFSEFFMTHLTPSARNRENRANTSSTVGQRSG